MNRIACHTASMIRGLAVAVVASLLLVPAATAGQAPAKSATQAQLVVHWAPMDTNGDGGSWAWSTGGYQPVVHADAPSKAANVLNALEVGDMLVVKSNVIPAGAYRIVKEGGYTRPVPGEHDLAFEVDGHVMIADLIFVSFRHGQHR